MILIHIVEQKCKTERQRSQSFSDSWIVNLNIYGKHVNVLYMEESVHHKTKQGT